MRQLKKAGRIVVNILWRRSIAGVAVRINRRPERVSRW